MFVLQIRDIWCCWTRPGSFRRGVQPGPLFLLQWLVPWPVRFRVQQMGDQLALGEQHDHGEQRQYDGQCVRVSPVGGRKDSYDVPKFEGDNL